VAGRIPQTFIDDLLNRVDIVDIIDSEIPLKKTGRDYQALCPFHGEKTPSFTVSQEKQFYHCFGCGAHGSALGFLMNHRGLSFVEAIEDAARGVGLEVPYEGGSEPAAPKIDYTPIYAALGEAQRYFSRQLRTHPDRDRAVNYLKSRGLSGAVAKRFGIGFAPNAWDDLSKALGPDEQAQENLLKAGLIIENDKKRRYDRFRDRIMFPILDRRGRVIAFGGRVIDQGEPKYLNSPETPVFHKRRELYGLYQVRRANTNIERVFVVEGYMDVVALGQFSVNNAVASLGTATTSEQLEMLFKTAPEVVFCYDGDKAGRRAAWRALETSLPLIRDGRRAGFMFIPDGYDPDSFVREYGAQAFTHGEQVKPLSEFLLDEIAAKTNLKSIDGRARFVELTKPMVAKIPLGSFRQLLIQRITEMADMESSALSASFNADSRPEPAPKPKPKRRRNQPPSLVEKALKPLLFDPKLGLSVDNHERIRAVADPHTDLLADLLEIIKNNPDITTGAIVERYRDTAHQQFLAEQLETPLILEREAYSVEFEQAISGLLKKAEPKAYERAQAEMRRRAEEQAK
jgi:DNA primase